jgi:trans-aconitate methyltransferase
MSAVRNPTEAEQIFEGLYAAVDGKAISHEGRRKSGSTDQSLTYGEIVPHSFRALIDLATPKPAGVFFDLGCGTGKPVILAALLYEFSRLVGIELVPELTTAARQVYGTLTAQLIATGQPAPACEFVTGSFLDQNLSQADVVYSHATAFTDALVEKMEAHLHSVRPGTRIALIGRHLDSSAFGLVKATSCEMSWGPSIAYVYLRK